MPENQSKEVTINLYQNTHTKEYETAPNGMDILRKIEKGYQEKLSRKPKHTWKSLIKRLQE